MKKLGDHVVIDEEKLNNLISRKKTYGDVTQNVENDEIQFFLRLFHNKVPDVVTAIHEKIMAKGWQLFYPPAFYERNLEFYTPNPLP